MLNQAIALSEGFPTVSALIIPALGVDFLMLNFSALPSEGFTTFAALPCDSSDVGNPVLEAEVFPHTHCTYSTPVQCERPLCTLCSGCPGGQCSGSEGLSWT